MALDPNDRRRLAVEFCGLPFNTPLVLLSGCVGFGEEYTRVEGFSNRDAGAVLPEGDDARAEARQRAPPGVGDAGGDAQLDRVAEPRLAGGHRRDPALARLHRDAVLRQPVGVHRRGVRGARAAVRRLPDRRDGDQHLVSERARGRRAVRQRPRHVAPRGSPRAGPRPPSRSSPSSRRTRPTSRRTRAAASRPAPTGLRS